MIRNCIEWLRPRISRQRAISALLTVVIAVSLLGVTYADALDSTSTTHALHFAPQQLSGRVFFSGLAEEEPAHYRFTAGTELSLQRRNLSIPVFTEEETLADLLFRLNIRVEAEEAVLVDFRPEVPTITIASDFTCEVEEHEYAAYTTRYVPDSSLAWGEEKVVQKGADGYIPHTCLVQVEDGCAIASLPLHTGISTMQEEIIHYGTRTKYAKVKVLDYEGGTVMVNGKELRFSKALRMTGTAYTAGIGVVDTVTATGTTVHVGVVAVDPRVIPLGSKLFIEGAKGSYVYGVAVAEDTGVRGNVIDLYMNTYDDCINFGCRPLNVYILE